MILVLKKTSPLWCHVLEPSLWLGSWIIEGQWADISFLELILKLSAWPVEDGLSGPLHACRLRRVLACPKIQ